MKKTLTFCILALSLVLAACSSSSTPVASAPDVLLEAEAPSLDTQGYYRSRVGTYEVTISNLSNGQPFTPPVVATHPRYLRLFIRGFRTTEGVRQIAENGNVAPLAEGLANSRFVTDSLVALPEEGAPPPILPGDSRTFEIDGRTRDAVSFVSMLICTNDGFTGRTVRLPNRVGKSLTSYTIGYDAGTEINTEAYEDIVPPCAVLTTGENKGGTGESNPDLAENGFTAVHPNIQGNGDLQPSIHRWNEPVAKIVIKRVK